GMSAPGTSRKYWLRRPTAAWRSGPELGNRKATAFVVHALVGADQPELRCPSRPAIRARIQPPSLDYLLAVCVASAMPHVTPCGRSTLWARQKSSIGGIEGSRRR